MFIDKTGMATRYEEDDDFEKIDDGFHDDDPESPTYGQERVIDNVVLGSEFDGFFQEETRKLKKGEDAFRKLDYATLDKNTKRRWTRLSKRYQGASGLSTKHINPEEIDGYDFYGLATPPYNLDYLVDLSVENATHAACIQAKVVNIVGLGYKWEETSKIKEAKLNASEDDDKMAKLARKVERVTDMLDTWLEDMNMEDDLVDILMKVWADYEATGNGYIEVGRNRDGTIGYLGHVPTATVRVRLNRDGFFQLVNRPDRMIYFRNFGDRTTKDPVNNDPFPNELIHIKKHSPKSAYYGVPDIIAALPAVAGDKFSSQYNLDYFENKAIPRYALIVKGAKLSGPAERRLLEYFRREVKGKHHGTLYIPVPAPMGSNVDVKLEPLENKVQDGSFSKYREQNRIDIHMAHRVPPSKTAVEISGSSSASRESDKTFKVQVAKPEQRRLETKLNRIMAEKTDMFKFRFSEYDLIDEETMSRIHDRYIRLGVMNSNEVRAAKGLHPRVGGDKYLDLAAESEAKIKLQTEQAKAATMKPVGATGSTTKPGPARETTDGGKNAKGTKTPMASTPAGGPATKGSKIDQNGPRARER
jgi:PBSX family phage portal protein